MKIRPQDVDLSRRLAALGCPEAGRYGPMKIARITHEIEQHHGRDYWTGEPLREVADEPT